MSGNQISSGEVLGASTTVGGAAVLPLTGDSTIGLILPVVAIACGILILISFSLTRLIEKEEESK